MKKIYMEYEEEITFNDIPRVMANILRKCDLLERSIDVLREEIRQTNKPTTSQHIPMDVTEACDFLKIKKSTMYLYIQNGQIPVNKKGKKCTFVRENRIKWVESGCMTETPMTTDEISRLLRQRPNRRE